ncbi:hypothetical protein KM043_018265 [Ampulex compressa]|nr:hypothetical protein KM043_018265 [Ampulex compressa]
MIVQKLANMTVLNKVRHLAIVSKPSILMNTQRYDLSGRTSTTLSNLRYRTRPMINNINGQSLTKLPTKSGQYTIQACNVSSHGSHVRLWVMERMISVALPILLPAALLLENSVIDGLLAIFAVMHSHWGLEAIILDYVRPNILGPIVPKAAFFMLNVLSAITLAGLLVLIYNGPGIAKAVKNAWAIGKEKQNVA